MAKTAFITFVWVASVLPVFCLHYKIDANINICKCLPCDKLPPSQDYNFHMVSYKMKKCKN